MTSSKWQCVYSFVVAVAFILLSFDYPLAIGLTSNRVGVGLLVLMCVVPSTGIAADYKQRILLMLCFGLLGGSVAWLTVSYLASEHSSLVSIVPIMSVCFLSLTLASSYFTSRRMSDAQWLYFANTVLFIGFAISTFLIFVIFSYAGIEGVRNQYLVRSWFYGYGPGLNRIMNGIVVINAFALAIVVGVVPRPRRTRVVAFGSVVVMLMLVLLSGSRQSAIAFFGLVICIVALAGATGRTLRGRRLAASIVGIVLAAVVVALGVNVLGISDMVGDRFVATLGESKLSDSDASRLWVASRGLFHITNNPWFGLGPGVLPAYEGMYPHNGHVALGADGGLVLIVFWFLVMVLLLWALIRGVRRSPSGIRGISIVFISLVFVIYGPMSLFNDLIRDHVLWCVVGMAVALVSNVRQSRVAEALNRPGFAGDSNL